MVEHHGYRLRSCWLIDLTVGCGASSHRFSPIEKAPLRAGPFFCVAGTQQGGPVVRGRFSPWRPAGQSDHTKEVAAYA